MRINFIVENGKMLENRKIGKWENVRSVLLFSLHLHLLVLSTFLASFCLSVCVCVCVILSDFVLPVKCDFLCCCFFSFISFRFLRHLQRRRRRLSLVPCVRCAILRSCHSTLTQHPWQSEEERERGRAISVFAPSPKLSRARIGSTVGQVQAALR